MVRQDLWFCSGLWRLERLAWEVRWPGGVGTCVDRLVLIGLGGTCGWVSLGFGESGCVRGSVSEPLGGLPAGRIFGLICYLFFCGGCSSLSSVDDGLGLSLMLTFGGDL